MGGWTNESTQEVTGAGDGRVQTVTRKPSGWKHKVSQHLHVLISLTSAAENKNCCWCFRVPTDPPTHVTVVVVFENTINDERYWRWEKNWNERPADGVTEVFIPLR